MHDLIDDVFVRCFDNPPLAPLEDQARLPLATCARFGDRLAFTTDSYVVDPLVLSGRHIGKLAVCGTVNDLAVGGAIPLYLTCSVIIEEGLPVDTLRAIAQAMAVTARQRRRPNRDRRHESREQGQPATSSSSTPPASASSAQGLDLGADRAGRAT